MAHASNIHVCKGVEDEFAFFNISKMLRSGKLDEVCPVCRGYGEWNREICLVSFRAKRIECGRCDGFGWIETGDDLVAYHDIILGPHGLPMWIIAHRPAKRE